MMPQGSWDARYAPLASLFASLVAQHETGAACALRVSGVTVVDLWGGAADRRARRPWQSDSLCCAFSVTKVFSALVALHAAAALELSLDEPVARSWPEFAAGGKSAISIRQILAHQSGVVGCRAPLEPEDYYTGHPMARQLAMEPPWWAPGTRHGYQARTFGLLLDQILQKAGGRGVRVRLWELLANADTTNRFYLGVPKNALSRCVKLDPARATAEELKTLPDDTWNMLRAMAEPGTATAAAFQNPRLPREFMNDPRFQQADLASSSIHGTAAGMAEAFDALWTALPSSLRAEASHSHSCGQDEVLLTNTNFGLGLMLNSTGAQTGLGAGSFGHVGSGGSVLFHLPEAEATFVFLPNRLRPGVMSWGPTAEALMAAGLSLV